MIILPDRYSPRLVGFEALASGFDVRTARGNLAGRVVTPGGRFAITIEFPTMEYESAMELQSLLVSAKSEGLRMAMPLGGNLQAGGAGAVDGSGAAGTTLPVKGLTPGAMIRQGYWATVIDAEGNHCLHKIAAPVRVGADGKANLAVNFPLRTLLADNDVVLLARPLIEGLITTEVNWQIPPEKYVTGLGFRIEEMEAVGAP
ncbi:MAG: hypothetical protein B7X90_01755 [Novosphingobium sp. 17-62-19]|uniref:hypothetical protein n=1 Tax=Novosphingobium sp. 17-62-19 TaxID=1970406 RepID=UPI000BDAEA56|nr:hypothetical protein [Novosphingobium sp. 17-62-19]OZA21362.1 MAG: hypothetical protein B7X90_01755 [Novosphingobium sp. 17-62-19]HQS95093.1 hypothetical protein [Novosphingobium sp.]